MYLRDILGSLFRRWPLLLGGFVITTGLCVALAMSIPATFIARTSMVLLPPPAVVGEDGNPFLFLGGLDTALDVLTRRLNAEELANDVEDEYPDATYTVYADESTSGPIVVVSVEATSARATEAVMQRIVREAEPSLKSLQVDLGVPADSLITVTLVAVDQEPKADYKTRIQAVGAVGAAGLVGTILLAGFLESRAISRRQRELKADQPGYEGESAAVSAELSDGAFVSKPLVGDQGDLPVDRQELSRIRKFRNPADPGRGSWPEA